MITQVLPIFTLFFFSLKINQILYQKMAKFLTNRDENYAQWYNDLVIKAELAENSVVRGCHGNQTIRIRDMGKNSGRS